MNKINHIALINANPMNLSLAISKINAIEGVRMDVEPNQAGECTFTLLEPIGDYVRIEIKGSEVILTDLTEMLGAVPLVSELDVAGLVTFVTEWADVLRGTAGLAKATEALDALEAAAEVDVEVAAAAAAVDAETAAVGGEPTADEAAAAEVVGNFAAEADMMAEAMILYGKLTAANKGIADRCYSHVTRNETQGTVTTEQLIQHGEVLFFFGVVSKIYEQQDAEIPTRVISKDYPQRYVAPLPDFKPGLVIRTFCHSVENPVPFWTGFLGGYVVGLAVFGYALHKILQTSEA